MVELLSLSPREVRLMGNMTSALVALFLLLAALVLLGLWLQRQGSERD